jgi:hypothetical protein
MQPAGAEKYLRNPVLSGRLFRETVTALFSVMLSGG